jgi:uncharacterized protein (TIGR01244 family)
MSSFRTLSDTFSASPQITVDDVRIAASEGFKAIICNRPDDEENGQLNAESVAGACATHGLSFTHIPISAGMNQSDIDQMSAAINEANGPVLAYCRSGTRSTNLWAATQAAEGADAEGIVAAAAEGGYDISGLTATLRNLAAR